LATVLVIEDDPSILENTLEILQFEGFDAIGAEDGKAGLIQAEKAAPDLIICDILMPKLDGYGVLRAIRANPATHKIPLVFISAVQNEDVLAASTRLGVTDFLVKPFRAAELIRVVNTLLNAV
jgi:DNA-binding response OmpR family regulator